MYRRSICALALGAILVVSAASVSTVPVAVSSATHAADAGGSQSTGDATDAAAAQTEGEAISALEAMRTVRNETNGTVVGVQQKRADEGGNGTPTYEVKVVQGNRTGTEETNVNRRLLAVDVHAINGTVLGTETQTDRGGFFETDENTDAISVSNSLNLSTTRSAINAAEIATNGSDEENMTVLGVRLTLRDQGEPNTTTPPLVYEVDVENVGGERVTVVVSARRGQEGVITVESDQNGG